MVKNPPSIAEDIGLTPSQGTNIPHALGRLSSCASTTEPEHHNWREAGMLQERAHVLQLRLNLAK